MFVFQIPAKLFKFTQQQDAKPTSTSSHQKSSTQLDTNSKVQEQLNINGEIHVCHFHPEVSVRAVPQVCQYLLPMYRPSSADSRNLADRTLDHNRALWGDPHHHRHQGDLRGLQAASRRPEDQRVKKWSSQGNNLEVSELEGRACRRHCPSEKREVVPCRLDPPSLVRWRVPVLHRDGKSWRRDKFENQIGSYRHQATQRGPGTSWTARSVANLTVY